MAKNGLLTLLVCISSGIGLAACSGGGGTPSGSGSETLEPPGPTALSQAQEQRTAARTAVRDYENRLEAAATAAERADLTLRLEAARADLTRATASVELEQAKNAVALAATRVAAAPTAEERNAALQEIVEAETLLAMARATADSALTAAIAAADADRAVPASAEATSFAAEVRRRASDAVGAARLYYASASAQIQQLRRQVFGGLGEGPPVGEPGSQPQVRVASISRVARTQSDGTAAAESDRLAIAQKAVPYSNGKRVIASDRSGAADELPLRELTVRIDTPIRVGTYERFARIQGDDKSPTDYGVADGVPVASIKLDAGEVVYKYGGEGVTFHDLQRDFSIGGNIDAWLTQEEECGTSDLGACYDWNTADVSVTWTGAPGSAPNGERVYYWSSRVRLPEGQSATHANLLPTYQNGRNDWDLGLYELWVTNYGGVDRNLEPSAGKGLRNPADDEDRFLRFAAYGLFVHTDTLTDYFLPSRVQAFHFGYDAFEDKDGSKTTDISTPVGVKFDGRTMGFMYEHQQNPNPARVEFRGDIVLNARIGGSGGGTISGEITSLEKLGANGRWTRFDRAANIRQTGASDADKSDRLVFAHKDDYELGADGGYPQDYSATGAPIKADGSYEGGVFLQQWSSNKWVPVSWTFSNSDRTRPARWPQPSSKFGGTLYGPTGDDFDDLDDLETAGYWYLEADFDSQRWGGLVGSFGATGETATQ